MTLINKEKEAIKFIRLGFSKAVSPLGLKKKGFIVAFSGGKDSVVLAHLMNRAVGRIPLLAVLADTEFKGTYNFVDYAFKEYGDERNIIIKYKNGKDISDCCRSVKVEKFKEVLKKYKIWFSGARADENKHRSDMLVFEKQRSILKINPILNFKEKDIWRYIAIHNLKINPIYRLGYRSLSCKLCSSKEKSEYELERAGRWRGTKNSGLECGIHSKNFKI